MPRSTARTLVRYVTRAAASGLFLAVAAGLPAGPATAAARAHSRAAVPNPGSFAELRAVTCTSASNCWAVGDYGSGAIDASEALHWDGSAWTLVPTPNPAAAANGHDILYGITCVSATDCWAVGEYGASSSQHRTLALRWNGSSWSQVATPNPGGLPGAWFLAAVSCTAANNCWAVGHHSRPHGDNVNMALHWTGKSWSWAATPEPDAAHGGYIRQLNAIRCPSRTDCWAVGSWASPPHNQVSGTEAFRWNGSAWSSVRTPKVGAETGVACTAPGNCWAVGGNAAVHWTGARWSQVATPHSASKFNTLLGATCARATECWAAGILNSGGELTDMLRWNGTRWARVATPSPGTSDGPDNSAVNELDGVACGGPTSCWAVGSYWDYTANTRYSIVLRWNGATWSNG